MKTFTRIVTIFSLVFISFSPSFSEGLTKSGKGTVVLTDHSVYFGEVTFNSELDLVTVGKKDRTYTFSSYQVQVFQYYDVEKELNRIYTSVEISNPNMYSPQPKLKFLEMVVHGDFSILRSETTKMVEKFDTNDRTLLLKRNFVSEPVSVVGFDYYFTKNGYTQKLTNFRKQVLPLMNNQPLVRQFISDNEIDLSTWEGQYRVIDFYNNLDVKDKRHFSESSDLNL